MNRKEFQISSKKLTQKITLNNLSEGEAFATDKEFHNTGKTDTTQAIIVKEKFVSPYIHWIAKNFGNPIQKNRKTISMLLVQNI